jgi:hypothetical protein
MATRCHPYHTPRHIFTRRSVYVLHGTPPARAKKTYARMTDICLQGYSPCRTPIYILPASYPRRSGQISHGMCSYFANRFYICMT